MYAINNDTAARHLLNSYAFGRTIACANHIRAWKENCPLGVPRLPGRWVETATHPQYKENLPESYYSEFGHIVGMETGWRDDTLAMFLRTFLSATRAILQRTDLGRAGFIMVKDSSQRIFSYAPDPKDPGVVPSCTRPFLHESLPVRQQRSACLFRDAFTTSRGLSCSGYWSAVAVAPPEK